MDSSERMRVFESLSRIDEKTSNIEKKLDLLTANIRIDYVHKNDFKPVKSLMYGLVSVILLSVFGSILTLVINK